MTEPVDWDKTTVAGCAAVSQYALLRCRSCNRDIMHAKGREFRICPGCGAEIEHKAEDASR